MDDDDPKLPDHVLDAARELARSEPVGRAEVLVAAGHIERVVDGTRGLVTVTLTDRGLEAERAGCDVFCDLRPSEARRVAAALLDLADDLDPPEAA